METIEQAEARLDTYASSILQLFSAPVRVSKRFAMPKLVVFSETRETAGATCFCRENRIEFYGFRSCTNETLIHEMVHAWIDQFDSEEYAHGPKFQERQAIIRHRLGMGIPAKYHREGRDTPPELSYDWPLDPAKLVAQEDEERRQWELELREQEDRDRKRREDEDKYARLRAASILVFADHVHRRDIKRRVPDVVICQFAEAIVNVETMDLPNWARSASLDKKYRRFEQVRMELRTAYEYTDDWEKTKAEYASRRR